MSVEHMGRHLVIRADATAEIGMGHVMRCSALAQAWRRDGGEVTFVGHIDSEELRDELAGMGFNLVPVKNPHPNGEDLKALLDQLNNETSGANASWCILDGYHFDSGYQKAIRDSGHKLLVVDDHHHLPEYHADIIFNQNLLPRVPKYVCNKDTTLLLGPQYIALRRQFLEFPRRAEQVPAKVRNILVTMGGADPCNVSPMVVRALNSLGDTGLSLKVVVGHTSSNQSLIEAELASAPYDWEIIRGARNMPELMAWADMAISAGGSTCWELAYMGVPFLVVVVAENQRGSVNGLAKLETIVDLGWGHDLEEGALAGEMQRLIEDQAARAGMSARLMELVDGLGSQRTVEAMVPTPILLRQAQADDCETIWRWRNALDVRQLSFDSEPIPLESHTRWFASRMEDPDCIMFMAQGADGETVGYVRFDVQDGQAVTSVILAPDQRGKGLGSKVIAAACRELLAGRGKLSITACIKEENQASKRAFSRAGFVHSDATVVKGYPAVNMRYVKEKLQ